MGAGCNSRIAHIDGLRGIAVLSVLIFHVWFQSPSLQGNHWLNLILGCGRHGVDLFFVLSGFCLSYPTLTALHSKGCASFDLVKYGARRLVRILPPYWAAMLACGGALIVGRIAPGYHVTFGDALRQALFLDKGATLINPSFWTLAIEFRWYFLMPLALLLWVRAPRVFGLVLLAIPVLWSTLASSKDLLFLPGFLLGIVAADLALRRRPVARYAPIGALVLVPLAVLMDPQAGEGGFNPPWMLAAFFLVVSAGHLPSLRAVCSMRWLTVVGVASYSIYLVHQPALMLVERWGTFAMLAIPLATGFAFWRVAERPFVEGRLRERLVALTEEWLALQTHRLGLRARAIPLSRPVPEPIPEAVAAEEAIAG